MAKQRTNVPVALKRELIREAGEKCANPGCPSKRTHIHHINEWHVYETHEGSDMVAICPTCHDAVHYGSLPIGDETLRRWKGIERPTSRRDHVYVEPGETSKYLLGSFVVTAKDGLTVFDLGHSRLSFRIADGEIMLVDLVVSSADGREILRIVSGHVKHEAEEPLRYERTPGHIRLTAPVADEYMPDWALRQLRVHVPAYANDGQLTLLDLEVIEPGLVGVEGIWHGEWDGRQRILAITSRGVPYICAKAA